MTELQCWFEIPKNEVQTQNAKKSDRMTYSSLDEMPATGNYLLHCGMNPFDGVTRKEILEHAHFLFSKK